ncbi:MAG: peptidoglycan biosynthesis protein MviN/MurJ (putative lipid II flippase) [Candidatus Omnitrophota bacterium]|jgi:peptidoglycan biosynthesis protein MviN/MurJ (putative lipid II flippase)
MLIKNTLTHNSIVISIIGIISRGSNILVPVSILRVFGMSLATDLLFLTFTALNLLTLISTNSIQAIIVPHIAKIKAAKLNINMFINSVLWFSTLAICILYIILSGLAEFTSIHSIHLRLVQTYLNLNIFLSIALLLALLSIWQAALTGLLNFNKKFIISTLAPVLRTITTVASIHIFGDRFGINSALYGYVCGDLLITVFLIISVITKCKFCFKFTLTPPNGGSEFYKSSLLFMVVAGITALNPFIDTAFALSIAPKCASALHIALAITLTAQGLLIFGYNTILPSHWSEKLTLNKTTNLYIEAKELSKKLLPITLLLCCMLFISSPYIAHGVTMFNSNISSIDENRIALLIAIYSFTLIPCVAITAYSRCYLVYNKIGTLLQINSIRFCVNILLNLVGVMWLGIQGIVIATVLHSFLTAALMIIASKNQSLRLKELNDGI